MPRKQTIRKALTHDRFQALYSAYNVISEQFNPENDHEELLYEHVQAFRLRLAQMAIFQQKQYTITMDSCEALAFMQLWNMTGTNPATLQHLAITSITELIDKKSKQPKI